MIKQMQMTNKRELLDLINPQLTDLCKLFNKEEWETLLISGLQYIEAQLNCQLIGRKITINTKKNRCILPFWPIIHILSLVNEQQQPIPYTLVGNKLQILNDNNNHMNSIYQITYQAGYDLSIMENIPIKLLLESILFNYYKEGTIGHSDQVNILFSRLHNTYGLGDE